MKFSALAAIALVVGPAAAEVYFKEQFNDEVCALICGGDDKLKWNWSTTCMRHFRSNESRRSEY